ncbi:MAG: DNA mismatch repair endonuclease MutL [Lachnospiraceae bacterium]
MSRIEILDPKTIDQIAAGEVVERPASVVKELVENSMDAKASAITVEIRGGGSKFIRVTDNGCGIGGDDLRKAFLRHATSKIRSMEDLEVALSMGFRGEALASISSVSQVEIISKCPEHLMGNRYEVEGAMAKEPEEIGAPDGTTIIVRNLFYNTPARKKFLKSDQTENAYISDLMEHMALARPDISFAYIVNGKTKFATSGNGDLKEIIYRLYGREMANEVVPLSYEKDGIRLEGYLGSPSINQSNRNFENYFVNHRFIKSDIVAKGIEEAYRAYLMQHKFPFCVIHFQMDARELDVNVHPAKLEVRFHNKKNVYDTIVEGIGKSLHEKEMIAGVVLDNKKETSKGPLPPAPQPFETNRLMQEHTLISPKAVSLGNAEEHMKTPVEEFIFEDEMMPENADTPECLSKDHINSSQTSNCGIAKSNNISDSLNCPNMESINIQGNIVIKPVQMSLFPEEEKVLSPNARGRYQIIGQIFKTYWLFTYGEQLYFVDQHAAHEKVNYERLMKQLQAGEVISQQCNPMIIVTLSQRDQITLRKNMEYFRRLGFFVEEFGANEFALRSIPMELYSNSPKEMFLDILQELSEVSRNDTPEAVTQRIATIACKASVKGGMEMSRQEMEALLDEMLALDNPYHCPHGRPTIFSMSKTELEKKFKRIVE